MHEKTITERENARRVIEREGTAQWIPYDWVEIVTPSVMLEKPPEGQDGTDWWGCRWFWDPRSFGHAPDVNQEPIVKDITRWRDYVTFPDLDAIDWEAAAAKDLEGVDFENKMVHIMFVLGPFERTHSLLGFDEAFAAMLEEPEAYQDLMGALTDFRIDLVERIIDAYHPDAIWNHDDLGTQKAPMISLDMYREMIKPHHKRIFDAIHAKGVQMNYHSCGNMAVFIPDLIEMGAEMINPLQKTNNWAECAEKYGDKVCFVTAVGAEVDLPGQDPEVLRAEAREIIDTFGPKGNLLTLAFPSNVDSLANIPIVLDEYENYGWDFCHRDN